MSNSVTNICRPLRMRPTPKCVLMALADRANDDGVAWPSIAWLSEWTCFSRRAVMNALEEIEKTGLVRISKTAGKNSRCEILLQKVVDEVANPGTTCTSTRAGGAPVEDEEDGADPCSTCTSAGGAPVQEVHTHPGTTCTSTRAGGAHGGAGGAPDTSIDTINTSIKTPKRARKAISDSEKSRLPDGFIEFWAEYPKKNAKADAAKAWRQMKLHVNADERSRVMAGLARWKLQEGWTKDNGRYIPYAGTFLRGFRWLDESVRGAWDGQASGNTSDQLPEWCVAAGFEHVAAAQNARCHIGNYREFRDGKRIADEVHA